MLTVAVVVVAVAVVLLGDDLVAFEQTHAQQQWQGHLAFDRAQDPGVGLDVAQLVFESLQSGFFNQIAFVQQQHVAVNDLGPGYFAIQQLFAEVFGVDQGDDRVKPGSIAQVTAQKGHRHRQRVGQTSGFNHQIINGLGPLENAVHRIEQLTVDRAADAAVAEFDSVFTGGNDQIIVDANFTKLVDKNCRLQTLLIAENVIEKGGFPCPKKAGQNRHRQRPAHARRIHGCGRGGGGRGHGMPCTQADLSEAILGGAIHSAPLGASVFLRSRCRVDLRPRVVQAISATQAKDTPMPIQMPAARRRPSWPSQVLRRWDRDVTSSNRAPWPSSRPAK